MLLTGIDIIEIYRIKEVCQNYPDRFMRKIFTNQEIEYCRGRYPQIAARFATKEAVMKLLGTGIRGVPWKSIEVYRARGKAPGEDKSLTLLDKIRGADSDISSYLDKWYNRYDV